MNDVERSRYDSLPELLKLFLDQNPDYKRFVLVNGDWDYYQEYMCENLRTIQRHITALTPSSNLLTGEWDSLRFDLSTFLEEWESI